MKKIYHIKILIPIGIIFLFLAACGPSEEQMVATKTQIALEIFQTQTAAATPTFTPTATFTNTPIPPTPTFTNTPTPTPTPCSHVDLNGRYVDYRPIGPYRYGWILDVVQDGCEFTATLYFYLLYRGPGSAGYPQELTGTIDKDEDKARICFTSPTYCLNLVIFGGGQTLANGVEGWQFEKTEE
jgi:hypothetical protein